MAKKLDKILVIDLESTCWDTDVPTGEVSEIIEIGICELNWKTGEVLRNEGILVKPKYSKVSPFCTKLTTLTQEQVNGGVSYPEALQYLQEKYNPSSWTWASYGDYDREQFKKNDTLYGVSAPLGKTHINVKNLFALKHNLGREVGLDKACSILGLTLEGTHHRGVDDAKNISKVLLEVLWAKR